MRADMCDMCCRECNASPCECVPSEIADIECEYRAKADGCLLYGYPINKLNRYELIAIVAWMAERYEIQLMNREYA